MKYIWKQRWAWSCAVGYIQHTPVKLKAQIPKERAQEIVVLHQITIMQAYHDGFILSNFKVSWYNLTRSEQSNGFLGVGTKVVPVTATWWPGRAARGHCGALMSCGTEELLLSSLTDLQHTWDVQDSCGRLHTFPSFALLPQSEFFLLNEQFTYSLAHWRSIKDYFFPPVAVASHVPGSAPCSLHQTLCSSQFSSQAGVTSPV